MTIQSTILDSHDTDNSHMIAIRLLWLLGLLLCVPCSLGRLRRFDPPHKLDIFLAVLSGPQHEERRNVVRRTWFPNSVEMDRLYKQHKILGRFLIGHSNDESLERAVLQESTSFQDIYRVNTKEAYHGTTWKITAFLKKVLADYDPSYIVKVDDDVYIQMQRLPAAMQEWNRRSADYVGCFMVGAQPYTEQSHKFYEPQHTHVLTYPAYAYGPTYVLSNHAATWITHLQGSLRFFATDDVAMGVWMFAYNATFYDDRRLCKSYCDENSVGVWFFGCNGLCDPANDMPILAADPRCKANVSEAIQPMEPEHKFHKTDEFRNVVHITDT